MASTSVTSETKQTFKTTTTTTFDEIFNKLPDSLPRRVTQDTKRSLLPLDKKLLTELSSFHSIVPAQFTMDDIPVQAFERQINRANYLSEDSIVDRYGIPRREIGKGCFGTAYKLMRLSDLHPFTVKYVSFTSTPLLTKSMVLREFYYTRRLSSKYVARSLDLMISSSRPDEMMIVQDYAAGIDLFDAITKNLSKFRSIRYSERIVKQVIEAICHCHSEGIGHNDIKLENIRYSPMTDQIKLIDFGLSTRLAELATEENISYLMSSGTPGLLDHNCRKALPDCTMFFGDTTVKRMSMAKDMFALGLLAFSVISRGNSLWDNSDFEDRDYCTFFETRELTQMIHYIRDVEGDRQDRAIMFKPVLEKMVEPQDGRRLTFSNLVKSDWYTSIYELGDSKY
ncbi:hypothetical protein G9P44_001720 [Scheffersomyces stipitis]|nr:hypothetical protein G9P44_001720 [Scheffersomyces stipitis]